MEVFLSQGVTRVSDKVMDGKTILKRQIVRWNFQLYIFNYLIVKPVQFPHAKRIFQFLEHCQQTVISLESFLKDVGINDCLISRISERKTTIYAK